MSLTATISNVSRGSLHDGPGVRTVIYFKGCALRCKWCHNPETFITAPEIVYAPVKCICCGNCISVCPSCHTVVNDKMRFSRENCQKCGKCVDVCPTGALSLCGEETMVEELFQTVVKDQHYYAASGGGVTLSGGECLLQADFCAALLKKCKQQQIHTAIESALFVDYSSIEKVLPYVDFFYVDLKIADPSKHQKYTGQSNALILENIQKLSQTQIPITIRIPVIPGVNDNAEDMQSLGKIIASFSGGVQGVELLKYNPLASSKYSSIGKDYCNFGMEPQSDQEMSGLQKILQKAIQEKIPVYFCK